MGVPGFRQAFVPGFRPRWVSQAFGDGCPRLSRTQTDARGQSSTLNYDELGRAATRTWSEASRTGSAPTNYVESTLYNNSGAHYGTVQKVSRIGNNRRDVDYEISEKTPSYDALQRPTSSSTVMQVGQTAAQTLVQRTAYDSRFGRVKQVTYPQSAIDSQPVSIYQFYSSLGMLIREGFAADYVPSPANSLNTNGSAAIRVVSQVDGRGLITSERFGVQGVQQDWFTNHIYDRSGWLIAQCVNQSGACSMNKPTQPNNQPLDQRYRFDVYGNLKTQWHNGSWQNPVSGSISSGALGEERYTYDALHRITTLNRTGQGTAAAVSYGFDAIGKLTNKSDFASSYQYPTSSHRLSSVTLTNGQTQSLAHDANGNVTSRSGNGSAMALIYDIDNLPRTISQDNRVANFYSAPGGRYLQKLNGRDTWYLGKAYEREVNAGQVSTERYYLTTGSLLVIQTSSRKLNYLHTDRLGSPVSISEKPLAGDGKLGTAPAAQVEHKGFDPFGKTLDGNWGISNLGMLNLPSSGLGVNQNKRNQRGFTGHEHLDEFALIHMNGRAYDYNLGQFYGVDPIVQFPSNSQSLNPYGYLMNNPLSGTDPTGYCGTRIEGGVAAGCTSYQFGDGQVDSGDSSNSGVRRTETNNGANARTEPTSGRQKDGAQEGPSAINASKYREQGSGCSPCESATTTPFPGINDSAAQSYGIIAPQFDPRSEYSNFQIFADDMVAGIEGVQGGVRNYYDGPGSNGFSYTTATVFVTVLDGPKDSIAGIRDGSYGSALLGATGLLRYGKYLIPSCCCFAEGTLILTADKLRPIEEIQVGDLVWARDTKTGETALKPVTELFYTPAKALYALVTVNELGVEERVEVTDNHPYWVVGHGWLDSIELMPGMQIESFDRSVLTVSSMQSIGKSEVTYNFTVGDFHTYFVGEQRALVHNCACSLANAANLKAELRAQMSIPATSDPGLTRILEKLYRENATVGSGSTAAAVRQEIATGLPVGGAFHTQKATESVEVLYDWLKRNPTARGSDRAAAENVILDTERALRGE